MRRLLTFILFLCATIGVYAQTDYGLTVGGTAVNSSNRNDVMGDGTVSYDPTTHTLKLKDASIDGYATGSAIKANSRIVIDLDGNSTLYAPTCMENSYSAASESDFGTTITSSSGNGTLKMVGSYGIMTTNGGGLYIHDCTVNTDCISTSFFGDTEGKNKTLKIERAKADLNGSSNTPCIFGYEKLVFDGSKVIEPSGAYYEYDGFGAIYKSDGTFCVNMKIGLDEATDYGISGATLNDVAFTVNSENYADVLGDGTLSYNPEQNTLTMNGTHLYGLIVLDLCKPDLRINIVGKENSIEGYCMLNTSCTLVGNNTKKAVTSQLNVNSIGLASSLTIQNLAVEFIGSKQGFQSQSGTASLTLRNATVNANGAEGVFKSIPSLVLEDCEILTPEGAYYDAEKKYIVDESGNRVTGVVTIGPKVEPVVDYGIRIGSSPYEKLEITSENCSDVLGDGTVSYDPATNVLSLNNLQAPNKYIEVGELDYDMSIQTMEAMNKDLAGIKVKVIGDNALGSLYFYGGVNGTLCGDGNLLLQKNMDGPTPALHSWDNLLIEDCNLVARGGIGIEMWSYMGAPGKLTIRNATIKIESSLQRECIESLTDLVLDGCYIYSPAGAHYDKEKHAIVDKDGNDLKGNLIIRKGAPQFPGSGTEYDPFILSEGATFTTPVGEAYYEYTATEECVMQIEVDEQSGVTGDIFWDWYRYGDLVNCEILVYPANSIKLRINSTDPDNEVTVKIREPREGETKEKAILLNEGDNPIPAIDWKKVPMWYKPPLSTGTAVTVNFSEEVAWYIYLDNAIFINDASLCEIPAIRWSDDHFFYVTSMPEGGNANVKLVGPVTPEKGTGTKDDPFVLDDLLPAPSPIPGPGTPGTGPGGTGTGKYTNPPTIIAPPAGTSNCYTFTATDDCVLGLAVSIGNEFEGKLTINGNDAGNIEDREVLLRKGNVVMLDIVNAGKDDLVAINLREVGEGEIWYKAIPLNKGDNAIAEVKKDKDLAMWYMVTLPDVTSLDLSFDTQGTATVFDSDKADDETLGIQVEADGSGMKYSYANTTNSSEDLYIKVENMNAGCTANVEFGGAVLGYGINIDGHEVTIENHADVLGDGTISYDPTANVLTFNNANGIISVNVNRTEKFTSSLDGIKIKLIGDNKLFALTVCGDVKSSICGNGTLFINNTASLARTVNFYTEDDLVIEDCSVSMKSLNGFGLRVGTLSKHAKLTIRNASLRIESPLDCLYEISDLLLEGCTILSPVGAHFDAGKSGIVGDDGELVKGELVIGKLVTPEKGTGTKEDPFKLDDKLPTPGTGGGEGEPGEEGGGGSTPIIIITPPEGSSFYTLTATGDCVLGLYANVGSEFKGNLSIDGVDAGNIEDREILLHKDNVAMLEIANAGKDDMIGIYLRALANGDIWYMPIELVEGDNAIPMVVEGKNLAVWYKALIPADKAMTIATDAKGSILTFSAKNAETQAAPVPLKDNETGLSFVYDNFTDKDIDRYFMVTSMPAACTATVSFTKSAGITDITADDPLTSSPLYNINGQRVSTSYKGIVIRKGRKSVAQ